MLTSLKIKNFAIVSELELDFANGMTVFTGETGAGKSIMIDALMLALGGKASPFVIRKGEEKCEISACFQIDETSMPALWLKEHDLGDQNDEIILRRVLYVEGRSKSYINGQPFPLNKLKDLSEMLVDIHGQHQHQTLLHHATHRRQLDQYAKHQSLVDDVNKLYQQSIKVKQELDNLQAKGFSEDQITLLQLKINELEELALQEGEMQALHEEHLLLHHAVDYLEYSQQITSLLSADDAPNICQGLNQIMQILSSFPKEQEQIKNIIELINSSLIQCEEARDEIDKFVSNVQLDPERLQVVEERISQIHKTARKFHVDVSQLAEIKINLETDIKNLQNSDQEKIRLEENYNTLLKEYESTALILRASREKHATKLADEITLNIKQLGMPQGFVKINISPLDKMHSHGLDKVEYIVCTNPGMAPDSLSKVASGGELSRIGLAIHIITAQRGATPTLLFDEVDVGIGGATAALVGQLLRNLGERLQVFCVTHQPQVASAAINHFMVEKHIENGQTFSEVNLLTTPQKIKEIARMLGGLKITEQTLSHAEELLSQSN